MSERIIICPDCLMQTRLNPSGKIRKHLIGPVGSDWCLSSGSSLGQASHFGKAMRARWGHMELREDTNTITVYAPDQIELIFDRISDVNWMNVWERSEFPHPLITVDINKEGVIYQVMAMSSFAPKLLELYAQWLREIKTSKTDKSDLCINGDRRILIDRLVDFYHKQMPTHE